MCYHVPLQRTELLLCACVCVAPAGTWLNTVLHELCLCVISAIMSLMMSWCPLLISWIWGGAFCGHALCIVLVKKFVMNWAFWKRNILIVKVSLFNPGRYWTLAQWWPRTWTGVQHHCGTTLCCDKHKSIWTVYSGLLCTMFLWNMARTEDPRRGCNSDRLHALQSRPQHCGKRQDPRRSYSSPRETVLVQKNLSTSIETIMRQSYHA